MKDHKGYEQRQFDWQDAIVLVACVVAVGIILYDLLVWRPW